MAQAITATYAQEDDDWTVKVAGLGKELQGRAPGIIAARDRADQLVEKLAGEGTSTTVVHLLNGSALEFTSAYMTARLSRTEPEAEESSTEQAADTEAQAEDTESTQSPETRDNAEAEAKDDKPEQAAETAEPATTAEAADSKATDSTSAKPDATGSEDAETPEPPAQRSGTKAPRKSAKRGVPRKELSKSPEAAPQQTTGEQAADSAAGGYAAASGTRRSRAAG